MKKIKKILASLMVAVMVLTAAPLSGFVGLELNLNWPSPDWFDFNTKASAATVTYSGTCGENLTWTLYDDGELIISGTGAMCDYSRVGSSVQTDAPWWNCHLSIKKVTIEDGVTSIGDYAFDGCSGLASITIPDSVTRIGASAFYCCHSLTGVKIPDSVTDIGDGAFLECSGLTSVTIPDGVKISDQMLSYIALIL